MPHRAPPGWDYWSALVGEGGDGLSSYYDFNVFEPDGTPRQYGDANADYQTDVLTRDYAVPFIDGPGRRSRGRSFSGSPTTRPHFGVGRDDRAGRRCSIGPPDDRAGRQSAIPPAALREQLFTRARSRTRPRSTRPTSPISRRRCGGARRSRAPTAS